MVLITQIEHALNYLQTKVGEIWSTDMIRRLPPFCQVVFEFFAKIMHHKNRPELFWQHLAQLILFLQTSQVVGAYWRVNIFCSCLQPWSESYVKVGLKYTKFYFDIHITYFLNYQIPSNFACIISIIRVNIWQKNILKNLIFSQIWRVFQHKSGENLMSSYTNTGPKLTGQISIWAQILMFFGL